MKESLKIFAIVASLVGLAACSSGQKSTKEVQTRESKSAIYPVAPIQPVPSQQPAANPSTAGASPVIVSPNPSLSGSATGAPLNQDQMQGMMDQCMAMHKDTGICSQRLMQDCQASASPTDCQNMMKNVKILRGQ